MGQLYKVFLSTIYIITAYGENIVKATSVTYNWTLVSGHIAPDGFTRSASLVNDQFPGPLLTANKDDSVTVMVHNNLSDPTMRRSTSIHWHGINDGTSFVTQCPIAPNNSFLYTLALGDQAGTFWYHSHYSTQYVDGIRGPIVIYDPNDPYKGFYDVDDENTIITLADWYHDPAPSLQSAWFVGGPEPVPDSGLINGVGRYSGGPGVQRARINVTQGKRYRFRIISMSAEGTRALYTPRRNQFVTVGEWIGQFEFSIANHSMTVIEADGISHEPYVVDSIPILAAQRYSVIVTANQSVDNYWIGATQTVKGATLSPDNPNFNGTDTFAVLHYDTAPDAEPTSPQPVGLPPSGIEFQEFNLKPLLDPGAPGGSGPPDQFFAFNFNFTTPNDDVWVINDVQYQSPSVPTLLNILANGFTQDSQFGRNESTFVLRPNSVIEVAFIGGAGHPFHLHGHTFDVVQSASGGGLNYVNPPRRDVVASGGTTENPLRIRFLTDNPGPWFIHCHIDWHLVAGLAAVFAEDPTGIQSGPQSVHPNAAWENLCGIYDSLDPSLQ